MSNQNQDNNLKPKKLRQTLMLPIFVAFLALIGGLILHELTRPEYSISVHLEEEGEGVPITHAVNVTEDSKLKLTVRFSANYYLKAGGAKAFTEVLVDITRTDAEKHNIECVFEKSDLLESFVGKDMERYLVATAECSGILREGIYQFIIEGSTPGNCYSDPMIKKRCLMTLKADYTIKGF